jgi:mannose-1-phosphate guanylyltransferase
VINADICSSFPLSELSDLHSKHRGVGTILGVNVAKETATKYGCIVHDPASAQVLHYVEKPEKWISSLINGGVYCESSVVEDGLDWVGWVEEGEKS